ncbi:unnamed protein product [Urochloa humidicola]
MVYGIVLFLLICFNQSKVAMLKFTGYKLLNNITDSGKAFLIILISDILLGYRTVRGCISSTSYPPPSPVLPLTSIPFLPLPGNREAMLPLLLLSPPQPLPLASASFPYWRLWARSLYCCLLLPTLAGLPPGGRAGGQGWPAARRSWCNRSRAGRRAGIKDSGGPVRPREADP